MTSLFLSTGVGAEAGGWASSAGVMLNPLGVGAVAGVGAVELTRRESQKPTCPPGLEQPTDLVHALAMDCGVAAVFVGVGITGVLAAGV